MYWLGVLWCPGILREVLSGVKLGPVPSARDGPGAVSAELISYGDKESVRFAGSV